MNATAAINAKANVSDNPAWTRISPVRRLLVALYILLCILPGTLPIQETNVYFNHIFIGIGIIVSMVKGILTAREHSLPKYFFIFLLAWALPFIVDGLDNPRFWNEQIKFSLFFLGGLMVARHIADSDLDDIPLYLPAALLFATALTIYMGVGDYYGEGGRFGIPIFGSPNTTAYIICVGLIFAIHGLNTYRDHWVIFAVISLALVGVNLRTGSDGGILMMLVIFLTYVGLSIRSIIVTTLLIVLGTSIAAAYLPRIAVPELIGSGRLLIWQELLDDYMQSDWLTIFFGFGPGAVELHPYFTAVVQSAHSTYIEILYGYGMVGFALLFLAMWMAIAKTSALTCNSRTRSLVEAILLMNLAGGLVDTYIFTAQLIWLGALLFGIIGRTWHQERERTA